MNKAGIAIFTSIFVVPILLSFATGNYIRNLFFAYIFWLLMVISIVTFLVFNLHVARSRRFTIKLIQGEFEGKVLSLVASYNEDPEMVKLCLASVKRANIYGDTYLVDDSSDERIVGQLREICEFLGVKFIHRNNREGFKAGALNYAIREHGGSYDLIAVFDADQMPSPWFFISSVGYFSNPKIAFVQYPPSYTDLDSPVALGTRYQQEVFLRKIMRARNLVSAFILGSGFIIRRDALESVGGFYEKSVTEDLATSILLQGNKWNSAYIDFPGIRFGKPPNMLGAYMKQQFRWSFGGFQTVKLLLTSNLSLRQFLDYLSGLLYWIYTGPVKLLIIATLVIFLIFRTFTVSIDPLFFALFYFPYFTYSLIFYFYSMSDRSLDYGLKGFFYHQAVETLVMFVVTLSFVKFLFKRKQSFTVTPKGKGRVFTFKQIMPHLIIHGLLTLSIVSGLLWLRSVASIALRVSIYTNLVFACLTLIMVIASEVMLVSSVPEPMAKIKALTSG